MPIIIWHKQGHIYMQWACSKDVRRIAIEMLKLKETKDFLCKPDWDPEWLGPRDDRIGFHHAHHLGTAEIYTFEVGVKYLVTFHLPMLFWFRAVSRVSVFGRKIHWPIDWECVQLYIILCLELVFIKVSLILEIYSDLKTLS